MQEQFCQRYAKQRDAGITSGPLLDPHSNQDEPEREERPGDGIRHVAGKIAGEGKGQRRADREIIGDLDIEEEENENYA